MRTWVIADTHFGHRNILQYEPRARAFETIEEHDATLIERWNERVRDADLVWHLGDFAMMRRAAEAVLPQLRGRIKLVLGNHDPQWWRAHDPWWAFKIVGVYGCVSMRRVLMTHMPTHHGVGSGARYEVNVHGHTHSRPGPTAHHVCVAVEQTDLAPVLLSDALRGHPDAFRRRA